jgi:hypothetical protein
MELVTTYRLWVLSVLQLGSTYFVHFCHIVSLFVWLVAGGWCWFVLRVKYCWLVAGLFWEKSTVGWWLISQTNSACVPRFGGVCDISRLAILFCYFCYQINTCNCNLKISCWHPHKLFDCMPHQEKPSLSAELMLFGVTSLLLSQTSRFISEICVPSSLFTSKVLHVLGERLQGPPAEHGCQPDGSF